MIYILYLSSPYPAVYREMVYILDLSSIPHAVYREMIYILDLSSPYPAVYREMVYILDLNLLIQFSHVYLLVKPPIGSFFSRGLYKKDFIKYISKSF